MPLSLPRHLASLLSAAILLTGGLAPVAAEANDITLRSNALQPPEENSSGRIHELVMQAFSLAGVRYSYGGVSADAGMDCSGLVRHVFKQAWEKDLPRTSEEISQAGQTINVSELQPGDLVFYNTLRRAFSHVGIYLGDNKFIHAPSPGGKIRIENMELPYWRKRYNGARRIADTMQQASSM